MPASNNQQKTSIVGIVVPLLLIVLITELAVMELFAPLMAVVNPLAAGIFDAVLLSLVYAVPLYLLLTGSFSAAIQTDAASRRKRRLFFWSVLGVIFAAELLVMLILPLYRASGSSLALPVLDAVLTTILVAPFICLIVSRQQQDLLTDLSSSPLKLYVLLLGAMFVLDMLEAELVPFLFPQGIKISYSLYDAFVTTLFTAPILWWLMVRPLQRASLAERVRSHAIQTQVVDAVVAIDADGNIISCNPAAEGIFGYAPAEINGRSAAILFCDGLLAPENLQAMTETGDGRPRATHEVICHRKDGHPITLEISVSRLTLSGEKQFLVIMRDISDRKKMEMALRESNERFDIAVSGASEGIWDWNMLTNELYYSQRLRELLGYQADDVRNEFAFIETLIHPDDHDRVMTAIAAHLERRIPYEIEFRIRSKLNQYFWFSSRGQAVWDAVGRPVRMAGSISDITSRKAAEEALRASEIRFREIFEQTEDALIFFSPDTCLVIDVNATAEHLFGFSKAELQAEGIGCLDQNPDKPRLKAFICGVVQGGISVLEYCKVRKKDGTEIVVAVRGKIMTLQNVAIISCTFSDITQRLRLEEQSREIQAKLIQANKMTSLGLMVSGVAHEINNPNNFILANAQLLEKSWHDALKVLREYYQAHGDFLVGGLPFSEMERHIPEMVTGIIDGTRRINGIISDLKGFIRQDRRTLMREIDINRTVQSAVSVLQSQIARYTDRFQLELGERLPLVTGNNQQLGQVVINLLMNACQALTAPQQGVTLCTRIDHAAQQVIIEVQDDGHGILPELGKRIMDPFFTTKLDAGGTGLGLSISQSIIREHGGSLEFTSVPGKGTTFQVRLPMQHAITEEQP